MSLAHNGHSQLSDSNTGERDNIWLYGGLSPLGKQVIAEMNRWGIMVDVSHPSKGSMLQAIASVEGADHRVAFGGAGARQPQPQHGRRDADGAQAERRRDPDGRVLELRQSRPARARPGDRRACATSSASCGGAAAGAARGGAGAGAAGRGGGWRGARVVRPRVPAGGRGCRRCGCGRGAAAPRRVLSRIRTRRRPRRGGGGGGRGGGGARNRPADALAPERRAEYDKRLAAIDQKWPAAGRATVKDFVDHIDYIVKLIGIDHVGISSDFDGGGGIDGWNSASRDVQRHARAGAPRLHRGADRQDLERQPAPRLGRSRKGGRGDPSREVTWVIG